MTFWDFLSLGLCSLCLLILLRQVIDRKFKRYHGLGFKWSWHRDTYVVYNARTGKVFAVFKKNYRDMWELQLKLSNYCDESDEGTQFANRRLSKQWAIRKWGNQ